MLHLSYKFLLYMSWLRLKISNSILDVFSINCTSVSNLLLPIYISITSLALVVLKLGSKDGALAQISDGRVHLNFTPYTVSGIFLYGLSFILYTYLLSKYDLGYIIPLTTGLVYIFIFIASFVIFKESFTLIKILGITFILGGIVLLNLNK